MEQFYWPTMKHKFPKIVSMQSFFTCMNGNIGSTELMCAPPFDVVVTHFVSINFASDRKIALAKVLTQTAPLQTISFCRRQFIRKCVCACENLLHIYKHSCISIEWHRNCHMGKHTHTHTHMPQLAAYHTFHLTFLRGSVPAFTTHRSKWIKIILSFRMYIVHCTLHTQHTHVTRRNCFSGFSFGKNGMSQPKTDSKSLLFYQKRSLASHSQPNLPFGGTVC